jgi:hypothetical protein
VKISRVSCEYCHKRYRIVPNEVMIVNQSVDLEKKTMHGLLCLNLSDILYIHVAITLWRGSDSDRDVSIRKSAEECLTSLKDYIFSYKMRRKGACSALNNLCQPKSLSIFAYSCGKCVALLEEMINIDPYFSNKNKRNGTNLVPKAAYDSENCSTSRTTLGKVDQ